MIYKNFITVELQYYTQVVKTLLRRRAIRLKYRCRVSNCSFEGFNVISEGAFVSGVSMGRHSYVGANSIVNNCRIGRFTCIGPSIVVGIGSHPTQRKSIHPVFYSTRRQSGTSFTAHPRFVEHVETQIGNDVWIGAGAIVKDGVSIGDGAIIGAGTIVTKSVPPFAVMVGNPAKLLRYRFAREQMLETLKSPWWNLPDYELRTRVDEFNRETPHDPA